MIRSGFAPRLLPATLGLLACVPLDRPRDDGVAANMDGGNDPDGPAEDTANQPPLLDLGPRRILPTPGLPVPLTATVTDDGRGPMPLRFVWTRDSGPADVLFSPPSAAATSVAFKVPGIYRFTCTVVDDAFMVAASVEVEILDLDDRLLARWPLDDDGALAKDFSGNGRDLSVRGAGWSSGMIGGALTLQGDNDWAEIAGPLTAAFAFGAGDFAVSFWIKTAQKTLGTQVPLLFFYGENPPEGYQGWDLRLGLDGYLEIAISEKGATKGIGRAGLHDNSWHHVVGQRQGGQLQIWIDAKFLSEKPVGFAIPIATTLVLGGGNFGLVYDFDGDLDDVWIFARALSGQEIAALGSPAVVRGWK